MGCNEKIKMSFRLQASSFRLKSLAFLFSVSLALMPIRTSAAQLELAAQTQEIGMGQSFQVDLILDTENQDINALEGKIIFPQDLLEIKKINDGNSIINLWIDKPKSTSASQIAFSGIVPGGYDSSQGLIFSITFLAKKEGGGVIEFNGIKALQNDGLGTEASLTASNYQFLISQEVPTPQITAPLIEDHDLPEEFTPQIAADPAIFDNKYFLVFATQDKGSGIDHYEVCEGRKKCVTAESPYLLQNQRLDQQILVKALDKNGNERVVMLPAPKLLPWYRNCSFFVILIIVGGALAYLVYKISWLKRKK